MAVNMGSEPLRAENVARAVKGFALQKYRLKQVLLVKSSTSNKETYFRESATELTGGTQEEIKGVPRGAEFPIVNPSWVEYSSIHVKFAAAGIVFHEDKMSDSIDVQARVMLKVGRTVAKAVDDAIYADLIAATGIGTAAAGAFWDHTTKSLQDPITDILKGIQDMDEQNYDALENGYLLVTPHDYRALMTNTKVINNPSYKTADVVSNGRVGQICGLTIIKTNSVDDDEALMIIGGRAATWQSAENMKSTVIADPGIKFTIRAWERGVTQVTDPRAIYRITNTQEA